MVTLQHKRSPDKMDYYIINEMVSCQLNNGSEARFEIDSEHYLGSGGNAMIYQCSDAVTGYQYAIKIQVATDGERKKRFKREVQLLKELHHEQLMRGIAAGSLEMERKHRKKSHPFAIIPLADRNLNYVVKTRSSPPSFEFLASQFRGLAEALAVLHERAIHRDIKPENILVHNDTWILADFGLCKLLKPPKGEVDITMVNEKVGPKYWMSPESMNRVVGNNDEITKASDVFQLAAVFWFAATKRHPTGIVKVKDWNGPRKMFDVLESALSHDPQSRPQDGAEFHERIKAALF